MISSYGHLVNVYMYIYRNPLEVDLTEKAEFYPYSTLFYKAQINIRSPFRLENILPPHAFDTYEGLDEFMWINQKYGKDEAASIRCRLQKTVFAYEKDKINNRPIEPIVRHPKKKTQEELWTELFKEEGGDLLQISYNEESASINFI